MATAHLSVAGSLSVNSVFGGLFSRGVAARTLPKPQPTEGTTWAVAMYVDPQGKPAALTLFDFSLACYAGAALSIVPASTANECIQARQMEELLQDNLSEVLNIGSAVFNTPEGRHVRLKSMVLVDDPAKAADIPDDFKAVLAKPGERLDVNLTINGYGAGSAIFIGA